MTNRVLSREEARAFYDRFGSKQDLQRFYEDPAIDVLKAAACFEEARAVVEFGCGTGRLARQLLEHSLPTEATYLGLDVSATMVGLAREKLARWTRRANVIHTDGAPKIPAPAAAFDRFVSAYVLDLLAAQDILALLVEARRVLSPTGRICLASLTLGQGVLSRGIGRLWVGLHALRPQLVGGCRPLRLLDYVGAAWKIVHREIVCTFGICTEVLVATPLDR